MATLQKQESQCSVRTALVRTADAQRMDCFPLNDTRVACGDRCAEKRCTPYSARALCVLTHLNNNIAGRDHYSFCYRRTNLKRVHYECTLRLFLQKQGSQRKVCTALVRTIRCITTSQRMRAGAHEQRCTPTYLQIPVGDLCTRALFFGARFGWKTFLSKLSVLLLTTRAERKI